MPPHQDPDVAARTVRRLATIAVAGGLAMAVLGCSAVASEDDPPGSVLTRAAEADSSFGVRYTFSIRDRDGRKTYRTRGYGQAEADGRRDRTVMRDGDDRNETVLDGHDEYGAGVFAQALLGLGPASAQNARWTKIDTSRLLDAGSIDRLCAPALPAKIAGVLARSEPTIAKLAAARVAGVRTTRYRVTTTYGRILDVLAGDEDASDCENRAAAFTATLWIDRRHLVRRVHLRHPSVDGRRIETRDLRYARNVRVAVPSGPDVYDLTDALVVQIEAICEAGLCQG